MGRLDWADKVDINNYEEVAPINKLVDTEINELRDAVNDNDFAIDALQGAIQMESFDTVAEATIWYDAEVTKPDDGTFLTIRSETSTYYWDAVTTERCLFYRKELFKTTDTSDTTGKVAEMEAIVNYSKSNTNTTNKEVQELQEKSEDVASVISTSREYEFTISDVSELDLTETITLSNNGDSLSFYGRVVESFGNTAFYRYLFGEKGQYDNSFGFVENGTGDAYELALRVDGGAEVLFDTGVIDLSEDHLVKLVRDSSTSYSVWVDEVLVDTQTVGGTGNLIIDNIGNAHGGVSNLPTNCVLQYVNITSNNLPYYFSKLNSNNTYYTSSNVNVISTVSIEDDTITENSLLNKIPTVSNLDIINQNFNERTLNPDFYGDIGAGSVRPVVNMTSDIDTPFGKEVVHRMTTSNDSYEEPFYSENIPTLRGVKTFSLSFWKDCFYDDALGRLDGRVFLGFETSGDAIYYQKTLGFKDSVSDSGTADGVNYDLTTDVSVNDEKMIGTHRWVHVSFLFQLNYAGEIDLDTTLTMTIIGGETAHNNNYYYDFFNIMVVNADYHLSSNTIGLDVKDETIAGCGDSIMYGQDADIIEVKNSGFFPQDGVGAFKNYIYNIAKEKSYKWYNNGISGSTLGNITSYGVYRNGFSDTRYLNLAPNLTKILLAFGFNDNAYGDEYRVEKFIFDTYAENRYYTDNPTLFDTDYGDGTFYLTSAQYDAVIAEASPSSVNSHFSNVYIGDISDTTNETFYGAYNIVIEELISSYPNAKIGIILPYGTKAGYRTAGREISKKFGLPEPYDFYDVEKTPLFWGRDSGDPTYTTMIGAETLRDYRRSRLFAEGTHPNNDGYEYIYTSIMEWMDKL